MPPLPAAAQVLKVRYVGVRTQTPWNCIMYGHYTGSAPTNPQLVAYGTALGNAWNTNIAPLCGVDVSLEEVDVVDLTSATSQSGTVASVHPGTRTGGGLGAQVALVSSWIAPLRYRGGHPRNYWPGGTAADLATPATWINASLTQFENGFAAFLTAINAINAGTSPVQFGLLSYHTGHVLRPTPLFVAYTGVTVHPRLDTQRRRLGKE